MTTQSPPSSMTDNILALLAFTQAEAKHSETLALIDNVRALIKAHLEADR